MISRATSPWVVKITIPPGASRGVDFFHPRAGAAGPERWVKTERL